MFLYSFPGNGQMRGHFRIGPLLGRGQSGLILQTVDSPRPRGMHALLYDSVEDNPHLPHASSLSAACQAACPVKINIRLAAGPPPVGGLALRAVDTLNHHPVALKVLVSLLRPGKTRRADPRIASSALEIPPVVAIIGVRSFSGRNASE
jgi:hypothetical protein